MNLDLKSVLLWVLLGSAVTLGVEAVVWLVAR
jgi:hypothetical protein